MYNCFKCHRAFNSPDLLINHLRYTEQLGCLDIKYCAECGRSFDSFVALRRHLPEHVLNVEQNLEFGLAAEDDPLPQQPNDPVVLDPVPLDVFKAALFNSSLTFCAKLYDIDNINRKNVQEIVTAARENFASGFLGPLRDNISLLFGVVEGHEELKTTILLMISLIENSFRGLETEHLRTEALKQSSAYIAPVPFNIGVAPGTVIRNGHPVLVQGQVSGHHVPLGEVIKQFFELPDVLNSTIDYMNELEQETNVIRNITQGTLWKENIKPRFPDKVVIPINIFGDEFEPDNSNGSHSGSNKPLSVHFSFPSIPQEFQSKLENIFIAAFILHDNVSLFGIDNCCHPIIRDLTVLEEQGVDVVTNSGIIKLFFALTLVRGDNLGLHSMLGFVECFTANYCCRICKVFRTQLQMQTALDERLLRTVDNYAEDLAINDVSLTGINSECAFNAVPSYHCIVNQYCDVMHDLPEGILKYVMCNIIYYLVHERDYFTLEMLHMRMNNFDYAYHEVGNTPPFKKLTADAVRSDSLNLSASEMLCFTIFFAEMVGDYVPDDDPVWQLYLLVREILDIMLSPGFVVGTEYYLQHLVESFLTSYLDLFHTHLTFKFHLLLHCSHLMRLIGPLVLLWGMRDEGKHRLSKIMAHSTNSRVNLPLTLLIKHQLKLAARFLAKRGLFDEFYYPTGDLVTLGHFDDVVLPVDFPVLPDEPLLSVEFVVKFGTLYKTDMVLIVGEEDSDPIFGKIQSICINENRNEIVFLVRKFGLAVFSPHFHAYDVTNVAENADCAILHRNLSYFLPLYDRISPGGRNFVSRRYV